MSDEKRPTVSSVRQTSIPIVKFKEQPAWFIEKSKECERRAEKLVSVMTPEEIRERLVTLYMDAIMFLAKRDRLRSEDPRKLSLRARTDGEASVEEIFPELARTPSEPLLVSVRRKQGRKK